MQFKRWASAFTIIELSIVIAAIGIMSAVVVVSFRNAEEGTDKASLEGGMSTFQNVLVEGSQRSDVAPKDIDLRAILAAVDPQPTYAAFTFTGNATAYTTAIAGVPANTQYQWTYNNGTDPTVTLQTKARRANWTGARSLTFRVNDCGTVCPVTLTGFDNYELQPNTNTFCEADPVEQDCNVILRKP
ncbi:MAG: type II secretion system protein [Vampirovibrionales bacterium]